MANWAAIAGCLAAISRPGLLLPDIAVRDIRALDWRALYNSGVRGVVFDKDNCLTKPFRGRLVPELEESFAQCQGTFGKSNVLIVSNSAGSYQDPLGIRAAEVSVNLGGTAVLYHKAKKPSIHCARQVISYFHERSVLGSILVVGDRPTTDVILSHRISDSLAKLRRTTNQSKHQPPGGLTLSAGMQLCSGTSDLSSESMHRGYARGVAVLTTGLWENEGRINSLIRCLENAILRVLVRRRLEPGGGWRRSAPRPVMEALSIDGPSIGFVDAHSSRWQLIATRHSQPSRQHGNDTLPSSAEASDDQFPFSHAAKPHQATDPQVSDLIRTCLPALFSATQFLASWRPILWVDRNFREGVRIVWLGLVEGLLQAGIWKPRRPSDLPEDGSDNRNDARLAPRTIQRSPDLPFFANTTRRPTSLLASGRGHTTVSDVFDRRLFATIARRSYSSSPSLSSGPGPSGNQKQKIRGRVPLRNWIAALSALVIAPTGYMFGAWLHELQEEKEAAKEADLTAAASLKPADEEAKRTGSSARREAEEARQSILLSKYHLEREKRELRDKIANLQGRQSP
ncbi:hypothetical protein K437DRAFT_256692 [Tilletiaria anomala UBC 951]|uniref:HAD-superfamily phosphatase n=1 Tax=Tilletiaria anomala (strain ATCC 24038 / CBS 436.72 / UBC 951) TaxID=1037660 RepID=A0A066VUT2_TILAU|nr:uncharacterized protein K437DRAFT_256692 [Tilletiaria anomala UBC 951]KDN45241.1 hypothetical protein K437DRAFT_256692 [Tilletiaria anomala UBC 951]